jgi:DNA mismatch repair ATPase MutS
MSTISINQQPRTRIATTGEKNPASYYRQRLSECAVVAQGEQQRLRRLSHSRLIAFLVGVILCLVLSPWPIALVAAAVVALSIFLFLVQRYRQAADRLAGAQALQRYFERGLARIEDHWITDHPSGEAFLDHQHPYAADLDLFGKGSLFQLLHLGWTPMGDGILARWMLAATDRIKALQRQEAIRELRDDVAEREEAAIRSAALWDKFRPDFLRQWGEAPPEKFQYWERWVTHGIVVLNAVAIAIWLAGFIPGSAVLIVMILMILWARQLQKRVHATLLNVDKEAEQLGHLSRLIHWFERQSFHSPLLNEIHETWHEYGKMASTTIAELARYTERLEWPRNVIFLPIAALLLWYTRTAFKVADWKAEHGKHIARWLEALGEMEALHGLASYAYEHPDYVFPEIVETGPIFDARQLGHPLISAAQCKCNDILFGTNPQLLLISGSNMSGKSTLLRTVGISVVLALLGAPVRAQSLRLSVFVPGATLRVQDSLQTGISRFYAEILRLRQLLDLAQQKSLLFLIDEILAGTNSAERRQGAAGILQALLDRGAVGLTTTHDLALTELATKWSDRASNVHFEDTWKDGHISFDYQLYPGVVSHGNALALMRAVGLEV